MTKSYKIKTLIKNFALLLFFIYTANINAQNNKKDINENYQELLTEYCKNCDLENIRQHIEMLEGLYTKETVIEYINYSIDKSKKNNPLEIVSENGCPNEVLAFLLDKGAQIEGDDRKVPVYGKKITPLMFSIRESHWETAEFLIKNGANVNANVHNQTPLRLALDKKIGINFEVPRLLIKKGADIKFKNTQESSLLMMNIEDENPESAKFLLNLKNDPELNNIPEINTILNVNVQNIYSSSALSFAIEKGYSEVASLIINYGDTDLELKDDRDGSTAVIFAYKMERYSIFDLLMNKGVSINEQDSDLNSLLILAADKGDTNTVKRLIENGANPDLQNNEGMTALMLSVKNGNTDICKILVSAGADKDLINKYGLSARDYTNKKHNNTLAKETIKELKKILSKKIG